jgi:hypothetical protein
MAWNISAIVEQDAAQPENNRAGNYKTRKTFPLSFL